LGATGAINNKVIRGILYQLSEMFYYRDENENEKSIRTVSSVVNAVTGLLFGHDVAKFYRGSILI
jgi:hypothetical protein